MKTASERAEVNRIIARNISKHFRVYASDVQELEFSIENELNSKDLKIEKLTAELEKQEKLIAALRAECSEAIAHHRSFDDPEYLKRWKQARAARLAMEGEDG